MTYEKSNLKNSNFEDVLHSIEPIMDQLKIANEWLLGNYNDFSTNEDIEEIKQNQNFLCIKSKANTILSIMRDSNGSFTIMVNDYFYTVSYVSKSISFAIDNNVEFIVTTNEKVVSLEPLFNIINGNYDNIEYVIL